MKYMNRITLCVSLCMLALFCSCDEERDIRWTTVEIDVWYPTRKGITLPEGLYDCSYEAAITYQTADSTIHTSLSGYARSLELMGAQGSVSIGSYQVENKDDFIIEEIFFTGTLQSSGKQYYGDGYVPMGSL